MLTLKIVQGAQGHEAGSGEMQVPPGLARFSIGRDPANHWVLADRTLAVSARHCEIVATPTVVLLRDLSTNGTFVNGAATRMAGEHALRDGDRFEIGPYTVAVQGVPAAVGRADATAVGHGAAATAPAPAPAPAPASAPLPVARRGGDPAAMLSAGGPEPVRLTEMLRAVPPPEDVAVEMTKIRAAPPAAGAAPRSPAAASRPVAAPAAPAAATAPAPTAVMPPPARAPVPPAPATPASPVAAAAPTPSAPAALPAVPDPVLAALASGLGLPAEALAGRSAIDAAAQVGAVARAAVAALREVLEQQAGARRALGSRSAALLPVRDVHPLRLAPSPEAALQALLTSGSDGPALLRRAADASALHEQRLLAAFSAALHRLGTEMAPDSLRAAAADPWPLYAHLWQGLGLAPGQPWTAGFVQAALLHLAAAYDEPAADAAHGGKAA